MLAAKSELVHDARPIVAQQHIRLGHELLNHRTSLGGL